MNNYDNTVKAVWFSYFTKILEQQGLISTSQKQKLKISIERKRQKKNGNSQT